MRALLSSSPCWEIPCSNATDWRAAPICACSAGVSAASCAAASTALDATSAFTSAASAAYPPVPCMAAVSCVQSAGRLLEPAPPSSRCMPRLPVID